VSKKDSKNSSQKEKTKGQVDYGVPDPKERLTINKSARCWQETQPLALPKRKRMATSHVIQQQATLVNDIQQQATLVHHIQQQATSVHDIPQ